ncbi:Breast cancer type 1 susceptibility protein like protein [Cyphomyrmex costatus]|uniref:Breast cancer type 1 susceptibility protein like protein n=2 Tax=Cyphomyrmex costatus TaxID=456900 RepID=A0A151IBZ4_9HYME|nr:Breast cancer type 1 susceptibility protein like protein [Cyphomyrmex costatus]
MENASCPLCKQSINRRSISKDDNQQKYIQMLKNLVIAIQNDTDIDYSQLLSYSKKSYNTKESCSYSDSKESSKNSTKEKSKEKKSSCQSNQNTNMQIDKPSTSRETMIDRGNSRRDLNVSNKKPETSLNPYSGNDETRITPDVKIRTWLHHLPDNLSANELNIDDSSVGKQISSIEDEARSISISDNNGKSDKIVKKDCNRINAKRQSNRNRKQSTDCSQNIDEDNALSQVNKGASQIDKVIELDSTSSKLKYKTLHDKIHAKENREKNAKTTIETDHQNSSSYWTAHDSRAASTPLCLDTRSTSATSECSTTNWFPVIEFQKEMKRANKKKVKKLNVSIEKNKNLPRIIEDIVLSPSSKYDSIRVAVDHKKSEKETNILPESSGRKQGTIDKNLSNVKVKALNDTNNQMELVDKDEANTTYVTLEEGRQTINLNIDKINEIISLDNATEARDHKKNVADYSDSSLSQQKRLTVTLEKLNESVSQTFTNNSETSSYLSAEKRTLKSRENSNVQETLSGAASFQLQSSTPIKGRLSLKKKKIVNEKSPLLSELPLSLRCSINEDNVDDRKNVNSSVPKHDNKLLDRLKVVSGDLNFKIREIQQRTHSDTISASTSKDIIEVEDNNENVCKIVHQDKKLRHNVTAVSKKYLSTKSKNIENQGHRFLAKFIQLGPLNIRRQNVKYFYVAATKREQLMPAEVRVTSVCNIQISRSGEMYVTSPDPLNDSQIMSDNITVVENTCFANNLNSNETVSKEFPASPICISSAISTPKKNIDSHLNQTKNAAIEHLLLNANQQSDKSIENVVEKNAQFIDKNSFHRTISRIPLKKSIKLLSPDKDSQLKFLTIDSPTTEREKLRHTSSIKSVIKGNNFSETKNLHLEMSTIDKAQELFIENSCKKRKRTRYASDRELFEDESNDRNDFCNSDSDSSRSTIKLDKYNELCKKASLDRLDEHKKRRLSSSDDEDVVMISSVSTKQDMPKRKFNVSSSDVDTDSESESTTHVAKNLKSDNQRAQRDASITDLPTKQCSTKQNSEDLSVRNIIDKSSNDHNTMQTKLMKESKNSQNSLKSIKSRSGENPASHQSPRSNNALNMEKKSTSQKSSARESNLFESSSFFNSENVDYILQSSINANDTSKKIADFSNDDIINRVLRIDRSQSNTVRRPDSTPRNDITSQREKDIREKDNFVEIIVNVEQPQSEDFIPCSEQPDHPKQKTSNCLAMTDESCGVIQETPIMSPSSTNDMFEQHSSGNVKKLLGKKAVAKFQETFTDWITKYSDEENVVYNQKSRGYVDDRRDRKDSMTNVDAFDKDSRKIVSKHNVSREKEEFLEERNVSIQSPGRLDVNNDKINGATVADNESILGDETFNDSLMNITEHQARLQMFEKDLFGIASQNQTKATKTNSQNDPQREQRTPKKRKQTTRKRNAESEECFVDEDDVVENTPEKKMKTSGNSIVANESDEDMKLSFLTPLLKTAKWIPNTSKQHEIVELRSGASTPKMDKRNERVRNDDDIYKQVNTKMLKNIRWQCDKRDLCFVCSGLSANEISTVKEFAAKHNASYVNQFDHNVTHVILKTVGELNIAKSTLKYVQGIAHGKWLVSYRWIEDCNMQQKLLDEVPYEATTQTDLISSVAGPRNSRLRDKDLFEGFTFLCIEPYDNVSQNQYEDLLRATGATVVNSFDALAKKEGLKGIVIQDNIHDDETIEYWHRITKAAPIIVDWIVECISQYKLFKVTSYSPCLSSQDFCALGYPRELVEEDEGYSDNE